MPPMLVDAHAHVLPPWLRDERPRHLQRDATFGALFASPKARFATAEELLESMDQAGVDASVAVGFGWTDPALARSVNDYAIDAAIRHPRRLLAFCSVNPAWGPDAVAEVQRCARAGAAGIGELHPDSQAFDLSDKELMAPLMEAAAMHQLPVLIHASEPVGHSYPGKGTGENAAGPRALWGLIRNFPDNIIILAHWGGGLPFYALMPEVGDSLSNVYVDTAASPFLYRPSVYPTVVNLLGPDRVLWASDFPLVGQQRSLGELNGQPISDEDRRLLAGGNAARLLRIG